MIFVSYFSQRQTIKSFCDCLWIGRYLVEEVLPNNIHIVQEPYTNKTQILHRVCRRKGNPKKLPADNYQ